MTDEALAPQHFLRLDLHEAKGFLFDQLIWLLYANASCVQTGNDIYSAICV
jgi:hypothetical protein